MSNPDPNANHTAPHSDLDPNVVFHVHDVTKVYPMGEGEVQALRGVDMDLYRGELVVLLGPSGSGKSTLLNILGGWTHRPPATCSIAAAISPTPASAS